MPDRPLVSVIARLRAEVDADRADTLIERPWLAPGATVSQVNDAGVSGLFARPAGPGPFPGIILFGGSAGGLGPTGAWAASLASHGFAALAISYFGAPGLPPDLVDIEVQCVERARAWLLRRDDVTSPMVGVMGVSRGSELALLAGALLDGIGAVVAFAPSGVAWNGLSRQGPVDAPSWTFRGRPIPSASTALRVPDGTDLSHPVALRPLFDHALQDQRMIAAAEIPIERIRGPILLVSGESDAMWASTPMAEIVERRAARHDFAYTVRHLRYPDAGHVCGGSPGTPVVTHARLPLDGGLYAFGGSRATNAAARADSWPRVLDFLAAALGSQRSH